MTRRDLTFRVFVSSTFSDLKAERNASQETALPRPRAYCQKKGARFQAIDLRWGVSEEAALDKQTMSSCIQEMIRCQTILPRPNFIIPKGERYGWRPLSPQIEASEKITFTKGEIAVMAEMEHGRWNVERLLDGWKRGKRRDLANKISTFLAAWCKLLEDVREWNTETVCKIPEFLAKVGLEVRSI